MNSVTQAQYRGSAKASDCQIKQGKANVLQGVDGIYLYDKYIMSTIPPSRYPGVRITKDNAGFNRGSGIRLAGAPCRICHVLLDTAGPHPGHNNHENISLAENI